MAKWEAQRAEDARRLKRDRRELDQQARELLKLPTRKERAEVPPTLLRSRPLSPVPLCSLAVAPHAASAGRHPRGVPAS